MRQDVIESWKGGDERRCPFCGEMNECESRGFDEDFSQGHRIYLYCECHACGERFGVEYKLKCVDVFE